MLSYEIIEAANQEVKAGRSPVFFFSYECEEEVTIEETVSADIDGFPLYHLIDGVWYEELPRQHFIACEQNPKEEILGWAWNTEYSEGELLSWYGFDETDVLDIAEESDKNVTIWRKPYYFEGTLGAPIADYIRDERTGEILNFDSYADAKAWIEKEEEGVYYLSHGEAGRPDYFIVNY